MAHHIVSTGMQRSTHTAGCGCSSDYFLLKAFQLRENHSTRTEPPPCAPGAPAGASVRKHAGHTEKSNQYAKSIAPTAPGDLYAARVCVCVCVEE